MSNRVFHREEDLIAADVVKIGYRFHTELSPGLLQSAYAYVFCYLLRKAGHQVETEKPVAIEFDGLRIATAFRADVVIDGLVIVELKAVKGIEDLFLRQLLTHVRLSGKRLGMLVNFGAISMDGQIKRVANGMPEA